MAATKQSSSQGWIQYGPNRRYNPLSGEVQYNLKGVQDPTENDWQTVATLGPYDPNNPGQNQALNPNLTATVGNRTFQVNQPGGGWALPNAQTLRQIYYAQAAQQAQQQAAGQGSGANYYGGTQGWGAGTPTGWGGGTATGWGAGPAAPTATGGGSTTMATTSAGQIPTGVWGQASPADIQEWQKWYGANLGKTILVNGQPTTIGSANAGDIWNAFQSNQVGFGSYSPQGAQPQLTQGVPNAAVQPETRALQQMAQIDPTGEALRQALGKSYLGQLTGGQNLDLSRGAAAPSASDVQSYLSLYKQLDPSGYAQRAALAGQMGSYLQQLQSQAALGARLDPGTIREVEQGTRAAQAARGNVYGTPQLVAETMARGTAGEQRLLQRQQALAQGRGGMQSYLTSGAGMGDVANNLYNQGFGRYMQGFQTQQNLIAQRQQAALGYLGSAVTPYQAATGYINQAQQSAANAAQGGPQYNPSALGQQYGGTAQQFPQYGLDMSQLAGNWYNNINSANLQAYGYQQAYGQKGGGFSGAGAATGALGGAASGALAGSAAGGIGAIPGALIGAIGGGLSGGFSR